MPFTFTPVPLAGVVLIEPKLFTDDRGWFMETYKRSEFAGHGIDGEFLQCNQSRSAGGTLRGLHFQRPPRAQGKLVRVLAGEIFDVVVDIRRQSATFGRWYGVSLTAESRRLLYVPAGFAHGFCVVSDSAEVLYMTTDEYAPAHEGGVAWNDPEIGIQWPISDPVLSERDRCWPRLREIRQD